MQHAVSVQVREKYSTERADVDRQMKQLGAGGSSAAAASDQKLASTLQLTLKRLDLYEQVTPTFLHIHCHHT